MTMGSTVGVNNVGFSVTQASANAILVAKVFGNAVGYMAMFSQ